MTLRVLILGGTTEASAIATAMAGDVRFAPTLSLAGRTRAPILPATATRRGGFGGVAGLTAYLQDQRIDALIDATHPFAAQMSRHACESARQIGLPCLAVVRPAWQSVPGDRWTRVADMEQAAAALGPTPRRVFLTIGQQELAPFTAAPWHDYLIRSIEHPDLTRLPPRARCVLARGPFNEADETRLLQENMIDILVSKNAGGSATAAKLAAARSLGMEVVMVDRPPLPDMPQTPDAAGAVAWLHHQRDASAARGV